VTAPAGQVLDRRADDYPGHDQRQQRPPGWLAVEAEALGQVGEHPGLDLGDQLEEPVDQERDHHAQDRRQDQQDEVFLGPHDGERISWGGH
jgi:hypothetical protein